MPVPSVQVVPPGVWTSLLGHPDVQVMHREAGNELISVVDGRLVGPMSAAMRWVGELPGGRFAAPIGGYWLFGGSWRWCSARRPDPSLPPVEIDNTVDGTGP